MFWATSVTVSSKEMIGTYVQALDHSKCPSTSKINKIVNTGNVFSTDWDMVLDRATAVVSTLGGFGTNEEMEKLNGDANIIAVNAASQAGDNDV
jgi:predicted Rossmann-fold nucleotide-binding protein